MKGPQVYWFIWGTTLALSLLVVRALVQRSSRLGKRRRRNYGPVESRARRPMVKFSVRPPRDKE